MTDFDGEMFMIYVRIFVVSKNLVHDNRMAKCDVKVSQTPHIFFDSPGICQGGGPVYVYQSKGRATRSVPYLQCHRLLDTLGLCYV